MICGNENTLGKAVFNQIEESQILSREEIEIRKENGKILVELWNE